MKGARTTNARTVIVSGFVGADAVDSTARTRASGRAGPRTVRPSLAGHLRGLPGRRQVRLVALTGYGHDEDRRRSRDAGFARHLVEPIHLLTIERLLVADAEDRAAPSSH